MRVGGLRYALAALPPGKRPGAYCTGGWVEARVGPDLCRKSFQYRDSIPGPSSP
jgi:hypothetical protein